MREISRWDLGLDKPSIFKYSSCGRFLAIGNQLPENKEPKPNDGYVSVDILDAVSGKKLSTLCDKSFKYVSDLQDVGCLCWGKDNKQILVGHRAAGGAQLWDIESKSRTEIVSKKGGMFVQDVFLDDEMAKVIDSLNMQWVFNFSKAALISESEDEGFEDPENIDEHESEPNNDLAKISPDGKTVLLVTPSQDDTEYYLELRNFAQSVPVWKQKIETAFESFQFLSNNQAAVAIDADGNVFRIDINNKKIEPLFSVGYRPKTYVFSEDASFLATIGNDAVGPARRSAINELIIWDLQTKEPVARMPVESGLNKCIAFSPVNKQVLISWMVYKEGKFYNQLINYDFSGK